MTESRFEMNTKIKLALYVVLGVAACVFGYLALGSYKTLMAEAPESTKTTALDVPALEKRIDPGKSKSFSKVVMYGAGFFVSVIGLGLLVGHAAATYLASRTVKVLYNDEGEGMKDPEYEVAEQEWANGHHLEAIRLMRDYLKKNPREQHVAIRIAEIYEKDLQNHLAAALEYEEVLKQKLSADRWSWSAIHLCNLHFKLGQQDKAIVLLRRIDSEYPNTPAAEKARKRLAQLEESGVDTNVGVIEEAPAAAAPAPPASGLPPGFTLKKG